MEILDARGCTYQPVDHHYKKGERMAYMSILDWPLSASIRASCGNSKSTKNQAAQYVWILYEE